MIKGLFSKMHHSQEGHLGISHGLRLKLNNDRHTSCVSSMSARYFDFLSPAGNGPVFTNPNVSINLLERYNSGGKSSDESFVAILSLILFGVASMVLNSMEKGGFASRSH